MNGPADPAQPADELGRIVGVVAVVGPTAAGKSDLGIELAQRLHGEIVNADSMQLYRGMDVGTAKLLGSWQRGVPHHLLDIWEVTETASVAVYQQAAREVMEALLALARTPVLVGGSGLYVRAVLDEYLSNLRVFSCSSFGQRNADACMVTHCLNVRGGWAVISWTVG
jgi:hypothetical protein